MKLTTKDKDFLERLKAAAQQKGLFVEMKESGLKSFVLRKNYGDKVESLFHLSRQGVRWRFQRLFNDIYVSAYETIFFVEAHFGTDLRQMALEIAKERVELRKEAKEMGGFGFCRRENGCEAAESGGLGL